MHPALSMLYLCLGYGVSMAKALILGELERGRISKSAPVWKQGLLPTASNLTRARAQSPIFKWGGNFGLFFIFYALLL